MLLALTLFILAGVALFGLLMSDRNVKYKTFMAQCAQDHKEYECVAMWRAGDNLGFIPIPIVIPSR